MSKGKHPLTPELESKFTGMVEAQFASMTEELAADQQIVSLVDNLNRTEDNSVNPQQLRNSIVSTILQQLGIQNSNTNNRGNRGNRGGGGNDNNGRGNRGNNADNANRGRGNFNIESELQQRHEALLDKVAALLNPDQQPVIRKLKYQEIKAKGGPERVRGILEEEGTPLTVEQYSQIQTIFNTGNQSIRQYAEELATLEIDAVKPEDLIPPAPDPKSGDTRQPNPNNVNSNPRAQQIVAKLIPRVSVRNAAIEKATMDSVMKVLTPEQVASYKINAL